MNHTITQYLQSFMYSNEYIIKEQEIPFFSPLSRTFLSSLFEMIHSSNKLWKLQEKNIIELSVTNRTEYMNSSDYSYIPSEIRTKWIESIPINSVFSKKYTFSICDREFMIFIWFPTVLQNTIPKTILSEHEIETKIKTILNKMFIWLHMICAFPNKNKQCSKKVNIFVFLTNHGKFLPKNRLQIIDAKHANTAFTQGCISEESNIYIFREEEWFKVFIHESFHVFGMDFIDIHHENVNVSIRKVFPIDVNDIRSYETYTEVWGETINLMFYVYFTNLPASKGRLSMVHWIRVLEQLFRVEQTFSLFQCCKVLSHYKLEYTDLFHPEKAKIYKEKTQIFSYFVLKSIWLVHINSFLEFCAKQHNGKASIRFELSESNLSKYIHQMHVFAKSDFFLQKIKHMEQKLSEHKKRILKKQPQFAMTTLRMTLYEL